MRVNLSRVLNEGVFCVILSYILLREIFFALDRNIVYLVSLLSNPQVAAGESHSIGLRFTPQQFPGKADILIFINDPEDKNEETFSITAQYTPVTSR